MRLNLNPIYLDDPSSRHGIIWKQTDGAKFAQTTKL